MKSEGVDIAGSRELVEARRAVFGSLEGAVRRRAPGAAEERLADLRAFLEHDLGGIEADLEGLELGQTAMHASAGHLLALGGKRLRPLCVALAARVGSGFSTAARDLAVAAELVHSATLLHDDVVDLGERRRGAAAARVIYGNAASIFAGDWLLIEALVRVRRAGLPDVLDRALGVLGEMLEAEAAQLDARGRVGATTESYLAIVRGKTASLFRWALFAGARAGGLGERACAELASFGERLGVAFQITDDLLDVDGDPAVLGKEIHADLREGKSTYPLLLALERVPSLRPRLEAALASEGGIDAPLAASIAGAMKETGAIEEARRFAGALVDQAAEALLAVSNEVSGGPAGSGSHPALRALAVVAHTVAARRR